MRQRLATAGFVAMGCALGTVLRAWLLGVDAAGPGSVMPSRSPGFLQLLTPQLISLMILNTAGCALAGWLLTGPLSGLKRPRARALLVPGLLGGLTSYSALIGDAHELWASQHRPLLSVLLVTAALVVGLLAALAGSRVARP